MKIQEAQKHIQAEGFDGWLLYDFHGNNPLARRFLEISGNHMTTRRFFYWIPVKGEPVKIVHAIEAEVLDKWPGEKKIYSSWQSLESELKAVAHRAKKIAMEYSAKNAIPYVSKVDAGTVDLIRSFGVEVASSANFLLHFTSVLTLKQMQSQQRAAKACNEIMQEAWHWIGSCLKQGKEVTERDVQLRILKHFEEKHLESDGQPIVAVGPHSADPHFETGSSPVRIGDFILIDLWAKEKGEGNVFGDITRVAVADKQPQAKHVEVFNAVRNAQKAAFALVRERMSAKKSIQGWEVDEAARSSIRNAGYGEFFIHRTGHNIEVDLHGSGTHMDNLEMHDVRPILPNTCFSVEPGIYLPGEFGVRLESDVLIHADGTVEITGGEEDELFCLLVSNSG